MRQKSKKWMAVALSLAMLIAMLPSAALAEAPQEADSSPSSRTTADPDQNESPEIKPVIDGDKEVEVIIHGNPSALIVDLPDKTCFRAKPGGRAGEWVKDRGNSTSAATLEQVDDHTVRVILPKGKTFEKGQVITAYQAILVGTTLRSSPFVTYTVAAKPTVIQPMPDANGNLAATPDGYARITFDPTGEGSLVGQKKGEPASFDVLLGTSWAAAKAAGVTVPQDPTHSHLNMQFKGWTNLPADDGTVNEGLTITANFVELSNQDVIPYIPADPANPTKSDDSKVPTKDKDGKIVDKSLYAIIAFKVADADKAKGSLILGDKTDQQVISALIKKDSTWDKVTAPTIKVVDGTTTKANGYDPAIPAGTEPVETGKVYTAQFITNGQEITPGAKLPDGVFEVKVSRDESSVAANDLYGKSYAVFKDSKLGQDKFPTLEAADNFKEAKWYKDAETKATADPSAVAITVNTTFSAKAVSSVFDKDKVTDMIVKTQPKLDYVEGNADKGKLDLSNLVVTLTDKNGNKQDVSFDKLGEYGITANPANGTAMTVADHNGNLVTLTKGKLTAKTDNLTVTKENSKELVIPFEPSDPSKPAEKDDKNIPKEDDNNKPINREDYVVVGFKVSPDKSGTLTLGDQANKAVISALVKKDIAWEGFSMPTPNDGNDYTFWHWDQAPADKVADGQVRVASFIKSGDEINPNDNNPLPNNFHKVTVAKGTGVDGKEAEDKALFGKTYAVKKGEKLAEEKFPALVAEKDYKNPAWDMEKPWTVAVADKDVTYTASATSSVFDKDKVTKIEILQNPTKMTYTEGEKPDHDGLKIQLTDQNANTVDIAKDQLADYGITVTPAETTDLTTADDNKPFVAKVNGKDAGGQAKVLTANMSKNITVNPKTSEETVISYVPADKENPTKSDDTKVPTKDKDGKIVDKSLYDIVAFTVADADKGKGSLTLGDKTDQQVIAALIKKGSTWNKVTAPTIKVANATTTKANGYDPAIPAGTEPVETGKVYTAQFITNGQEITPETKLPDGVFEVKVSRDESSVAGNDLYGKSYAVFENSKLSQDKFPTLEAADNFKEAKWYKDAETKATADPSAVGITVNTTFSAKAVSSVFDKDKVTEIEILQEPTKMTYTEGEKPNHDGLKIQLTDQNANTVDIAKDQLADYGVTVTPAETAKLTVNDHQGRPFIARVKNKDGNPLTAKTKADITVKVKAPAQNKSSHRSQTIPKPEPKPTPKPETKPEAKPAPKLSSHDLNKTGHYSYLTGYPDGTFAPNKGMTRAEVASLFTRLLKDQPLKGQSYKAGLSDLHAGDWYADAVGYAVQKGIVSGYPDGTFKPNQAISRGEFAAIAARFAEMTSDQPPAFSDLDPNHWSYQAIRQVAANGWLSGYPDGSFKPNQPITRAEVATVSNRMLNRTPDLDRLKAQKDKLPHFSDVGSGDWFYGAIMEASFDRP